MQAAIRRVTMVGSETEQASETVQRLTRVWTLLGRPGEYTALWSTLGDLGRVYAHAARDAEMPDALFVVGGDGFLLDVIRQITDREVRLPICGWNAGHVGFHMNDVPDDDATLLLALSRFSRQEFDIESYALLDARLDRMQGDRQRVRAFNEVAFVPMRQGQIARLAFEVDGQPFGAHAGDGLIVSTSQGTTGWGVGARGPAVDPRVPSMVLIPKDPHPAIRHRQLLFPLILPPGASVLVRALEPDKRPIVAIADGREGVVISEASVVIDLRQTPPIDMISLPDPDGRGRFVRRVFEKFLQG